MHRRTDPDGGEPSVQRGPPLRRRVRLAPNDSPPWQRRRASECDTAIRVASARQPGRIQRILRAAWPWLAGCAILLVIASRVPYDAFHAAVSRGPHAQLALVDLAVVVVTLCTDSLSTWVGLIACRMRRPIGKVLAVRGATYVLFLINYALGQGGFGFYLRRSGASTPSAIGATLFLIGTNLATLLLLTTLALALHGRNDDPELWWILVACDLGFAIYLAMIALSPMMLARRAVLAPLFDANLRGHALAVIGRVPHSAVIVVGIWLAARTWGIAVPFGVGMALAPVVAIASVLPIAPAGLGTTQAALVYLFSPYATGATAEDRAAAVLAFAIVHLVYAVAASLAVGFVCLLGARRAGVLAEPGRTA